MVGREAPVWVLICIALVMLIGASLIAILLGVAPSRKAKQHELTVGQCMEVHRKVEIELSIRTHELDYRSFLKQLLNDIEKEEKDALGIPQHIYAKFLPVQTESIRTEIAIRKLNDQFALPPALFVGMQRYMRTNSGQLEAGARTPLTPTLPSSSQYLFQTTSATPAIIT